MYSHSFHAKLIWFEGNKKKSFNFSLRWHCVGWNRSDEPNVCGETGRNSKGGWSCTLITKINNCMIDGNRRKPRASILPLPFEFQYPSFALMWTQQMSLLLCCFIATPSSAESLPVRAQGFPSGCENSIVRNKEWVSEGIRLYLLSVKQPGAGKNAHGAIKK